MSSTAMDVGAGQNVSFPDPKNNPDGNKTLATACSPMIPTPCDYDLVGID